jgi:LPXTG-site transpeptidase (sortase) family protein
MQSKIAFRDTSLAVILTGLIALSPALLVYFIPKISTHSSSSSVTARSVPVPNQEQVSLPVKAGYGLPIRLKIPAINVDSTVEYVGLTSNGEMGAPKDQNAVAWFKLGIRPGDKGSAVIAGHYGIKNGKASVFDDLYKLHKGDKLYIEDDKGASISFVVHEIRRYDPKADASGVFASSDGKAHLNLITCEGVWDEVSKSYPARLVVFTDKD